jgi:hypothetical protein
MQVLRFSHLILPCGHDSRQANSKNHLSIIALAVWHKPKLRPGDTIWLYPMANRLRPLADNLTQRIQAGPFSTSLGPLGLPLSRLSVEEIREHVIFQDPVAESR